jgi:hypothetical protein
MAIAALALSGCASGRVLPAGVSGNEVYVAVSNVWNEAEALPYAEKHCRQYGKAPRLAEMKGYTARFDCVAP